MSRLTSKTWLAVAALALAILSVYPFVDRDLRYILEPDFPLALIQSFAEFFATRSAAVLPMPGENVYYDGGSLVQGFVLHLLTVFQNGTGLIADSPRSLALLAVNVTNAAGHVLAGLFVFLAVRRIDPNPVTSLMAAALFSFSPPLFDIGLTRIDRLMMMPLAALCYLGVVMLQGDFRKRHAVLFGLMLGFLATTKITGLLLGFIPASAFVIRLAAQRFSGAELRKALPFAAIAVAVFAVVASAMMVRYLLYWEVLPGVLKRSYALIGEFDQILPKKPWLYYNIDQLAGYGLAFQIGANAAMLGVILHGVFRRSAISLWLTVNVLAFSAFGVLAVKFPRGGTHLIPLYVLGISLALTLLRSRLDRLAARPPLPARVAVAALLAVPLAATALSFGTAGGVALRRPEGIRITRDEPRAWLAEHLPRQAKLCTLRDSDWANPPVEGLGLQLLYGPFDFPWTSASAMAEFRPPKVATLSFGCDVLLVNNFHRQLFQDFFRLHDRTQRIREWQDFYDELERLYPPVVFTAKDPAYFVTSVQIFDLRRPPASVGDAATDALLRLAVGSAPGTPLAEGGVLPPPWRTGSFLGGIDRVVRHGDGTIEIVGWATDLVERLPAAAVLPAAGGRVAARDGLGRPRQDIADHFKTQAVLGSGFRSCVPAGAVPPGAGDVHVIAISMSGSAAEIGAPAGTPILDAAPGTPNPCVGGGT